MAVETGELICLFAKAQFSMSAEYGGSALRTEEQRWSQTMETEESVSLTLKPEQSLYIWQYVLGLGDEKNLYCHDLVFPTTY